MSSATVLDSILEGVCADVAAREARVSMADVKAAAEAAPAPRDVLSALRAPGIAVIDPDTLNPDVRAALPSIATGVLHAGGRPPEKRLAERSVTMERAARQYLVLDEFHTYDGAQGTDVAMLLRRLGLTLKSYWSPTSRVSADDHARALGKISMLAGTFIVPTKEFLPLPI